MKCKNVVGFYTKICCSKIVQNIIMVFLMNTEVRRKLMGDIKEKVAILDKYSYLATSHGFFIKGTMPSDKLSVAIRTFAPGVDRANIIGFYDTTVFGSGKQGFIFTDKMMYWLESFEKPKKLWYGDIKSVEVINIHKNDCDRTLRIHLYGGAIYEFSTCFLNKTPFCNFLNEIISLPDVREKANDTTNVEKDLDIIDMLLIDPVVEGKKRGYEKAAREYSYAFETIEKQYEETKKILNDKKISYEEKSEALLKKLKSYENERIQYEQSLYIEAKSIAKKYDIPLSQVFGACDNTVWATTWSGGKNIFECFFGYKGLIYNYKEAKLMEAKAKGYMEAKELYEQKINKLRKELALLKAKGDAEICELTDLISEILEAIADEQMKIAALRIIQ